MDDVNDFIPIPRNTHKQPLEACPLCGNDAEMWEVVHRNSQVSKAAMCDHSEGQHGALGEIDSCPLSLGPSVLYRATYREAASAWNSFASACTQSRSDAQFRNGRG